MNETVRTAVVTGGGRGIGRAICQKLAAKGHRVVINYAGNREAAEETARRCAELGARVLVVGADIATAAGCEELFRRATETFGSVDILVNNAGITRDALIMRMSEEQFDEVLNANLKGTFLCMKLASRVMMKQRWGRIVNISSVSGVRGNPGQVNYSASKAGVIGMTKALAKELAGRGVTVNAVAPGLIDTDMTRALSEEVLAELKRAVPMARAGSPEEVAAAVAFLAGEDASYITGQVLCVDGGMAM